MERINPPGLPKPSGFTHAIMVPAATRLVFLAGQTGYDENGGYAVSDVVAQFERALANLLAALAAAGGTPAELASITIYVVNIDDYKKHGKEIGAAWRRLAGAQYPAMAAVQVARLWDRDALVELQATAAITLRK
jgi:enamine deaminase RidA (YjgF/YER057c/UK114 family)